MQVEHPFGFIFSGDPAKGCSAPLGRHQKTWKMWEKMVNRWMAIKFEACIVMQGSKEAVFKVRINAGKNLFLRFQRGSFARGNQKRKVGQNVRTPGTCRYKNRGAATFARFFFLFFKIHHGVPSVQSICHGIYCHYWWHAFRI